MVELRGVERKRRSKIRLYLIRNAVKQDKMLIWIFVISVLYAFVSNFISSYCPITCEPLLANLGNAADVVLRNTCYGVIAGIAFYLINDIYKNAYKKTDVYNAMFKELYMVEFNAYTLVGAISGDKYNKNMSREQLFQCIMVYICNENDEFHQFGSFVKYRQIPLDRIALLVYKWNEANSKRRVFLSNFGDLLTRDEFCNLNRFDDNYVPGLIRTFDLMIETSNQEYLKVRDNDIATTVNWIIAYKIAITDLTKKYINHSYSTVYLNRTYEEGDIF